MIGQSRQEPVVPSNEVSAARAQQLPAGMTDARMIEGVVSLPHAWSIPRERTSLLLNSTNESSQSPCIEFGMSPERCHITHERLSVRRSRPRMNLVGSGDVKHRPNVLGAHAAANEDGDLLRHRVNRSGTLERRGATAARKNAGETHLPRAT